MKEEEEEKTLIESSSNVRRLMEYKARNAFRMRVKNNAHKTSRTSLKGAPQPFGSFKCAFRVGARIIGNEKEVSASEKVTSATN